jgi:hypothetical protein
MWDELSTLPQYQISLVLPCNRVTNWTTEEFATNGANGSAQVAVRGGRRRRLLSSATAPVLTVRPNLYVAMACTFVTLSLRTRLLVVPVRLTRLLSHHHLLLPLRLARKPGSLRKRVFRAFLTTSTLDFHKYV